MYGFTIVDFLKSTTVHISSTFTESHLDQGHLSRMQSIRKSFRQSLKRLNVRRSMRGGQSTQRSFRPALVRSGSTRPSMKNRTALAAAAGPSPGASNEPTPMPTRRDSIRTITFSAPCHLARESCQLVRCCVDAHCTVVFRPRRVSVSAGWDQPRRHHGIQH